MRKTLYLHWIVPYYYRVMHARCQQIYPMYRSWMIGHWQVRDHLHQLPAQRSTRCIVIYAYESSTVAICKISASTCSFNHRMIAKGNLCKLWKAPNQLRTITIERLQRNHPNAPAINANVHRSICRCNKVLSVLDHSKLLILLFCRQLPISSDTNAEPG